MCKTFSFLEVSGKKEDDDISHQRKPHKFFKVRCCRSKCVPKTNLISCDVMFKFWNIWEISFRTNSALRKLESVCTCIILRVVVLTESWFRNKKRQVTLINQCCLICSHFQRVRNTNSFSQLVAHPRKNQIKEQTRYLFRFNKVVKGLCYIRI